MKKISRFPNYSISENGKLYSHKSKKYLNGYINSNGYKRYILRKDGKTHLVYAHQLVAIMYVDNPDNKPQVNHIDGDKLNNSYKNLEWVTMSENIIHGNDMGLIDNSGQNNGMSKTNNDDVLKIRYLYRNTSITQKKLASIFNTSRPTIFNIVNYKTYTYV